MHKRSTQLSRRALSAVVVAAAIAAGCSSTTVLTENGAAPARAVPGASGASIPADVAGVDTAAIAPVDAGGTAPTRIAGRPPTGPTPVAPATGATATAPAGSGNAPAPAPAAGPVEASLGVTNSTIKIGIGWLDVGALFTAFADPTQDAEGSGTTQGAAQAVVDWINANGGIAGRQIEPLFHEYPVSDIANGESRRRREQAMCVDWTEDRRAFASVPYMAPEGIFQGCASDSDLIHIGIGNLDLPADATTLAEIGNVWYRPNWMTGERRERTLVDQLHKAGFFGPDAKVGLMVHDNPASVRSADIGLERELAARGIEVGLRIDYPDQIESPWSNYVLQFQAAGITHVLWGGCACGGSNSAFFMLPAEQQGYRPLHGLASDHWLGSIRTTGAPNEQLANATAIGWNPSMDGADPGTPPTATQQLCTDIYDDAGAQVPDPAYCESLFFLKTVIEANPRSITSKAFRASAEALGDRYQPVTTFAARFGPSQHDGASSIRLTKYNPETELWYYTSPEIPVG